MTSTYANTSASQHQGATRTAMKTPHRWQTGATAQRLPVWLATAGIFIIVALLVCFQQVVRGAVKQGAERQKNTTLLANATRECRALPNLVASARCSQQLQAKNNGAATQTAFLSGS